MLIGVSITPKRQHVKVFSNALTNAIQQHGKAGAISL